MKEEESNQAHPALAIASSWHAVRAITAIFFHRGYGASS